MGTIPRHPGCSDLAPAASRELLRVFLAHFRGTVVGEALGNHGVARSLSGLPLR